MIAKQIGPNPEHWTKNETKPQEKAVEWIKANIPEDSFIIIDCYPYVDLHAARFEGDTVFPNADWFWKYNYDPEIQEKFGSSWQNVDYILVTHELVKQMDYKNETNQNLRTSFENSKRAILFGPSPTTFIDPENYQSTNGDWAAVYERPSKEFLALSASWDFYKKEYLKNGGQVIDPANGRATSEGQSYALLRAVWMNDRDSFDKIWTWTRSNLQIRGDKLFSWMWEKGTVPDQNSASDADEDIALALVFAYKRWDDPKYLVEGVGVINDIWEREVYEINGRYVLGFSADARRGNGVVMNPSYFPPASYRIFAKVDTTHPWDKLADDTYFWLETIGVNYSPLFLPPNFVYIDETGNISSAKEWFGVDSEIYGFDGFRTLFRVALDGYWFGMPLSSDYLRKVYPFFEKKWNEEKSLFAGYTMVGETALNFPAISTLAGPLAAGSLLKEYETDEWYKEMIEKRYNSENGFWGDRNNYYDQNWAWFATALYSNNLPNLWNI